MSQLRHSASCKPAKQRENCPFKPAQMPLSNIRSLKYHLVVMLGARIDIIQPQIRNLMVYLLPLQDKKTMTAVVKHDKTSGLDRNESQTWSRLQHTLLIRKDSIKYFLLLLWARLKISCISRLCCVWNNVCVYVCKTTNWWFIIICNWMWFIKILSLSSGMPNRSISKAMLVDRALGQFFSSRGARNKTTI